MTSQPVNGQLPEYGTWAELDACKPCERCRERPAMTEAEATQAVKESWGLLVRVACSDGTGWHLTTSPRTKGHEPGA